MTSKTKTRIQTLKDRINSHEPYREWHCKDHNFYGTGGTTSFLCCQRELMELQGEEICPKCGGSGIIKK